MQWNHQSDPSVRPTIPPHSGGREKEQGSTRPSVCNGHMGWTAYLGRNV